MGSKLPDAWPGLQHRYYVMLDMDELAYERRFHADVIRKAKEFRQQWIDDRTQNLLNNPIDLLNDMPYCNKLIRDVMNAETPEELKAAQTAMKEELSHYAFRVADHQFDGGRS